MSNWSVPECWLSVEAFASEMKRIEDGNTLVDERVILQLMRFIYDREENDPGSYPDLDRTQCFLAIQELERVVSAIGR